MAIPAQYMARTYVELPTPERRRFGLFSAATVIDVEDSHILMGAHAETIACKPARLWEHTCPVAFPGSCGAANPAGYRKKIAHGTEAVVGDPFTVYESIDCKDKADYSDEVRASLLLKEEKAVEKHVMALLDAEAGPQVKGGDYAPDVVVAAEQWLAANYEGVGIIHAPRGYAVGQLSSLYIDIRDREHLFTIVGTPYVAGAGYEPAASLKPGEFPVWASGQIVLYRGPVLVYNVPGTNGPKAKDCLPPRTVAERTYVALIECGAAKFSTVAAPVTP